MNIIKNNNNNNEINTKVRAKIVKVNNLPNNLKSSEESENFYKSCSGYREIFFSLINRKRKILNLYFFGKSGT